eukprot:TRINITY_DN2694_c0_g1_i1.p1 TRINITY_DN2694_c0_g1~~TRINITY_DN2694_c0_g1_i1.p1  ORF type:complete len:211 (+),score=27.34 TRINITY_DN2694_c0_g1_i1:102-734(+)
MGGSRRRLKKGKPKVKVGLPKKRKELCQPDSVTLPAEAGSKRLDWDGEKTLNANYIAMGLVSNPNFKGGRNTRTAKAAAVSGNLSSNEASGSSATDGNESSGEVPPHLNGLSGAALLSLDADDEDDFGLEPEGVKEALGKAPRKDPLPRLTRMQRTYVGRLIQKYGDDYEAMFRDLKLNQMQHPVGALRSLCLRFHLHERAPKLTPEAPA